jgi:hypothetical protein
MPKLIKLKQKIKDGIVNWNPPQPAWLLVYLTGQQAFYSRPLCLFGDIQRTPGYHQ